MKSLLCSSIEVAEDSIEMLRINSVYVLEE